MLYVLSIKKGKNFHIEATGVVHITLHLIQSFHVYPEPNAEALYRKDSTGIPAGLQLGRYKIDQLFSVKHVLDVDGNMVSISTKFLWNSDKHTTPLTGTNFMIQYMSSAYQIN